MSLVLVFKSLALASDYQFLALEVVLDIGLEHSNFLATNRAPASILTSVKRSTLYLDFIPEQSSSAGSVYSWKAVQQEADFQVGLLHHLLENIFCSTATSAQVEGVKPQWTVHAPKPC